MDTSRGLTLDHCSGFDSLGDSQTDLPERRNHGKQHKRPVPSPRVGRVGRFFLPQDRRQVSEIFKKQGQLLPGTTSISNTPPRWHTHCTRRTQYSGQHNRKGFFADSRCTSYWGCHSLTHRPILDCDRRFWLTSRGIMGSMPGRSGIPEPQTEVSV